MKLEEENRNLKKTIEELKETISKLKLNNDNLFKTNEKLLKEKNNLKNELLKANNNTNPNSAIGGNTSSVENSITNELLNTQTISTNKNKKSKKMNKTKTNMGPLFSGQSLILLKKIQDENKELAKQLKDFNSKNFQLELSIKGINGGETGNNTIQKKNSNSMLNNFTNYTRNELKNIEKKYGLTKK